jgi:acyl-CoA thioesterase-1
VPARRAALFVLLALAVGGCNQIAGCAGPGQQGQADVPAPAPIDPATGQSAEPALEIAFLGDSLTAGLGLLADQAYPNVIKQMFHAEGYTEVDVVNGGSSGDTTAGGARRVEQLLGPNTRILVVALGGNDALRGLTVQQTHDNLASILDQAIGRRVAIMLAGMLAPTNLGEDYQKGFQNAFVRLAREYQNAIVFVPFLLEGVAGDPALNQDDGIHPNAQGARVIAERLFPGLRRLVDDTLNAAR